MKARLTKIVISNDIEGYNYKRYFDLNVPISEYRDITFYRPLTLDIARTDWKKEWPKIGAIGQKIALEVMAIPGVEELRLRVYSLEVQIGQAFDWNTDYHIESRVLDVIRKVLNQPELDIENQDPVTVTANDKARIMLEALRQKPAQRKPAPAVKPQRAQQKNNSK